jgi:hypothetical protein
MIASGIRLSRALGALVALALGGCCELGLGNCPPTPSASRSECWSHVESAARRLACADDSSEPNDTIPMARDVTNPGCTATPVPSTLSGDDVDVFHAGGTRCDSSAPRLHLGTAAVRACPFVRRRRPRRRVQHDEEGPGCVRRHRRVDGRLHAGTP